VDENASAAGRVDCEKALETLLCGERNYKRSADVTVLLDALLAPTGEVA
jgi:hypothetical protein